MKVQTIMTSDIWNRPKQAWRAIYGIALAALFSSALIASVVLTVQEATSPAVEVQNEPVPVDQEVYRPGESITSTFRITQRKNAPFKMSRAVVCENRVAPLIPIEFPSRLTGDGSEITFDLDVLVVEEVVTRTPKGPECWLSFTLQVGDGEIDSFRSVSFEITDE